MALRMTEEEYMEFQRRNKQRIVPKPDYQSRIRQTAPTCCQPARASGVSLEEPDEERRREMTRSNYAAQLNALGYDASGNPLPVEKPKRQKYGNKRVEIDGVKFDSKHEAAVYQELMLRVRAGELKTVCRQVKFDLPGGIVYIADFVAIRPDLSIEGVYDAKSKATQKNRVYINKKKQMKACLGIEIREV